MDLISFIPGVGPTALFSPGPTTPAPFNVNHRGATDGTSPQTATNNMAEIYNRVLLQIAATISASGISIDNDNWAQLPDAIKALAQSIISPSLSGLVTASTYNADFTGVKGPNGWQKIKGGLIIQWGSTPSPSFPFPAFFSTTFPIAFPNQIFQVYGTVENRANASYNTHEADVRLSSKNLSTCTWYNAWNGDNDSGGTPDSYRTPIVYWFAIGY